MTELCANARVSVWEIGGTDGLEVWRYWYVVSYELGPGAEDAPFNAITA